MSVNDGPETRGEVLDFFIGRSAKIHELEHDIVLDGFRFAQRGLEVIGLPDVYQDMSKKYLSDVVVEISDITPSDDFPEGSQMTVARKPTHDMRVKGEWHRKMILHPDHIARNYDVLTSVMSEARTGVAVDDGIRSRLALLWCMFSQVAGIASESVYAVNVHDGYYSTSFNGHSPFVGAQKFLSEAYKEKNPGKGINVNRDTMQLRYGVALYLLGGFLRSSKVLGPDEVVDEVIEDIIKVERRHDKGWAQNLDEARAHPLNFDQIQKRIKDVSVPEPTVSDPVGQRSGRYGNFFLYLVSNDTDD